MSDDNYIEVTKILLTGLGAAWINNWGLSKLNARSWSSD
jgi:hypothetical protein